MSAGMGFLIVLSILSVSGLFTLWQTRTSRQVPDWRETVLARQLDEEAIRRHDEELGFREPREAA